MSENRRIKRKTIRFNVKGQRQIDWRKILISFRYLPIMWIVTFLIIFIASYLIVNRQNSIRKSVLSNSREVIGKVIAISKAKNTHNGIFEYVYDKKIFQGSTFDDFKGKIGDEICIKYSVSQPEINIYCKDSEFANFYENVLLYSLKTISLLAGFTTVLNILIISWMYIKGNKKFIEEITKQKYRKS